MGRWAGVVGAALLCLPAVGQAENFGANVQLFQWATGGPVDYLSVRGAQPLPLYSPSAGVVLGWQHKPLVFEDGRGRSQALVKNQFYLDAVGAIALHEQVQIGVGLPLTLYQHGDRVRGLTPQDGLSGAAAGDLRLDGRWSVGPIGRPELQLALLADVTLPTGQEREMQGHGSLSVRPAAVLEWHVLPELRLAVELGYLMRENLRLDSLVVGNELTWGVAGAWRVLPELDLLGEVVGHLAADPDFETTVGRSPVELRVGGRYALAQVHLLSAGVGMGLNTGYGAPAARLWLGYTFAGPSYADRDGDGIPDAYDACPDEPEDFDGFEDGDGCPEFDNDRDGIPDALDLCPNLPEDFDGFEDEDGCPDPDNDGDGIPDALDKCPNEPGPPERDGCPVIDTDGDGVPDDEDQCPNEPGPPERQGCPVIDSDGDGIPDDIDQCPYEPETFNGFEDEDGCPDELPAVHVTAERIEVRERVHFKFGTADLTAEGLEVVRSVGRVLIEHPELAMVEIQGHTDAQGARDLNQRLSQARAESVLKALVKQGVAQKRLRAKGFGSSQLIDTARNVEAHKKNRRVEFHIVQREGG